MTWAAAAASRFQIPAMDVAAIRSRAPAVFGVGCVSLAGAKFCGSSSVRSKPFACLSISTDASESPFPKLVCMETELIDVDINKIWEFCLAD